MIQKDIPSSSELDRLVQCGASHNMGVLADSWDKGRPEYKSSDMQFGLNVHEALQLSTAKGLQSDEERMAFSVMSRQKNLFIQGWLTDKATELFEHRMWLHKGIVPIFTGRADYILIEGNRALILDYKSLWNKVPEPADNHQLRSLAVLLWLENKNLSEITIQIIASHHSYSAHTLELAELSAYLTFLEDTLKVVNQANAPVPGDWCRHCRGLLICPAIRKTAVELVKSDEKGDFPQKLPTGETAARLLSQMTAVSALIDRVRDHYRSVIAEDPKAVPGWWLQPSVTRKFTNTPQVFRILKDKFGEAIFDLISISVPKAFSRLNQVEQTALESYVERSESPSLRKKANGNKEIQSDAGNVAAHG